MIMIRYADDIVVGFQHQHHARRFWDAMRERLQEFSLSRHPEKTRLIELVAMRQPIRPRSSIVMMAVTADTRVPRSLAACASGGGG